MKRSRIPQFVGRLAFLAVMSTGVSLALLFLSEEVSARVGGGQSYGGGSGGGGGDGDGGAIIWLIFEAFRFLVYLTIEYPLVGIPLDILVGCGVVYYLVRRSRRKSESSILRLDTHQSPPA